MDSLNQLGNWSPVYVVASAPADAAKDEENCDWADSTEIVKDSTLKSVVVKEERCSNGNGAAKMDSMRLESVHGVDRPFFHIDLEEAVNVAIYDAKRKDQGLAE
jgi:sodium-independent sulfate anion transporter 11